jgi:hypothetical protein
MSFKTFFKLAQEEIVQNEPAPVPTGDVQLGTSPPSPAVQPVGTIDTFVNKGKKGSYLAVSVNADPATKKQANAKFVVGFSGYNEFRGKPTKLVTKENIADVEAEVYQVAQIFNLEVNAKGLEYAKSTLAGEKYVPKQSEFKVEDLIVPGDVDATVDNLATKFKDILKGIPASDQSKTVGNLIDQQLEMLAGEVDDAAKNKLIQNFLAMSSRLYNYSFFNQMLIFFQTRGQAKEVQSYKKWQLMGRQVKRKEDHQLGGILIYYPMMLKNKDSQGQVRINPQTGEEDKFVRFKLGNVFDISDTEPFTGVALERWKKKNDGKNPYEPIARDVWMSGDNEDTDYTAAIRNAAIKFADSVGIQVDLGKDTGTAGGWSAGGNVAINVESAGVRQASTIMHEIAHELIHWAERKEKGKHKLDYGHKEIETDAEASAYIIMKHFGFEVPSASNYLALKGVNSAGVRKRKSYIQKAVKQIIDGIYANFPEEYKQASKTCNWYKSARRKNIYKKIFNSL